MNPTIKAQWVAALRSGLYPQTKGVLTELDKDNNPIGYCCLGVLCDLAVKANIVNSIPSKTAKGTKCLAYQAPKSECGEKLNLPLPVLNWVELGTVTNVITIIPNDTKVSLEYINDDLEYNFEQIADLIEAQL